MEKRQVSVQEGYAHWAKDYDGYLNPLIAAEEPIVRELLGELRGRRVLDVGCGTGRHAAWMHAQGAVVLGLDASEEMLARAREKCGVVEFRQGSILEFCPDPPGFDLVLNALSAEHFSDLGLLIRALSNALRPTGCLILSVWHPFMVLKGVLTHYEDDDADTEYVLPTHPHLVSDYVREFRRAGLSLSDLREPIADEALVARMPHLRKHAGMPLALVLRATRG